MVSNTDGQCSIYENHSPPLGCVRRDQLLDSVCVNEVRTAAAAVVGTWIHHEFDGGQMTIFVAFGAALFAYVAISAILFETIGFVGDAVSLSQKIVLDKEAGGMFCKAMSTDNGPVDDLICLDLDNSMFWPKQNLYFAYRLISFARIT